MYEIYCKLRDDKGYKDSDVAKIAGITKSTFSDWKSGRSCPKNDKLQKIAEVLGVTVDYLMTGKESLKEKDPYDARKQRIMSYAEQMLDMGITPDDLAALIDLAEKMSKKD
jgi:transcriptional regulator with XRE-family HTH domain